MTEGGKDKDHLGQNLPDKNLCELKQTPCKDICMYACTTKNGGSEMCDVLRGSRDM